MNKILLSTQEVVGVTGLSRTSIWRLEDDWLWFGNTGSFGEHFLEVRVWDSQSNTVWDGMDVYVDDENSNC